MNPTSSIPRLRYQTLEFGALDLHVRSLRDRQQFSDDEGAAERLGIGSASWPLFGLLWDSGRELAHKMLDYDVEGRRVLEVGCGLGLASLILNHRSADITATDHHPEAGVFLQANAALNGDVPIKFVRADWVEGGHADELARFDLVIGSDVLYERGHAEALSRFVDRHAQPTCEVLIVDPGRGQGGRFGRSMESLGYARRACAAPVSFDAERTGSPPQFLNYTRTER